MCFPITEVKLKTTAIRLDTLQKKLPMQALESVNERIFEHFFFVAYALKLTSWEKYPPPGEGCVLRGQVRTRVSSVVSVEESEVDR